MSSETKQTKMPPTGTSEAAHDWKPFSTKNLETEHLKGEITYLWEQLEECREIIEQLSTHEVKDYIFIHPLDLYELMEKCTHSYTIKSIEKGGDIITIKGQKYKQTPNIPAKNPIVNKSFK
jgi:hypothetical protein